MNKYKKLAFNTVIFAIGSFGSKILVMLLTRLYTKNINPTDSSRKEMLELTANLLIPIVTFCMADTLLRYGLDKMQDKRKVFTTASCICGMGLSALFVVTPILGLIPKMEYLKGYTLLLIVYICTSTFRSLCSQFVRVRGMLKLFSFDGILTTLTLFIFNIIFISKLGLGVKGFLLSVIFSDFLSGVFLFFVAKHYNFFHKRYFDRNLMRGMLKYAMPLIPTAIMWIVILFANRIFIREMKSDKVFLGETAAGVYGWATKVPNLIAMVSTIFFQAWNMSAITEHDSQDRGVFYERVFSAYQSIMFVATGFIIASVQFITKVFVDASEFPIYKTAYLYTPLLAVGVMFMSFNNFLSSIYVASKKTTNSFWTSLSAFSASMLLNVILIPKYGIQGASVATLSGYFLCYIIRIIDTRKLVDFKVSHFNLVSNSGLLLFMCGLAIMRPYFYVPMLLFSFLLIAVINLNHIMLSVKKMMKK